MTALSRSAIYGRVRTAKRTGLITMGMCERCGGRRAQHAHHEDYSRPLDVQLFCRSCHRARHVERNAGETFAKKASAHIRADLAHRGPTSGEILTDRCKLDGINPHDDRAFGPVYLSLMRRGVIEKCGTTIRTKGHGTAGGNIWKLKHEPR